MPQIRITIIIPTRERGDVLGAALRSVCAQDYDGLDILVSDNFSVDATADIVRDINDPRVRYVNTGARVSMSQNWEFALANVPIDDRYVMVIGDDDAILPGALDRVAALISETKVQAVSSSFVTFIWPNVENAEMGRLLVPMRCGFEVRRSKDWLRRAIDGQAWYSELPIIYAGGAVHMPLLDEARRRRGSFFQSCQPDIYSSVVLSAMTDRYAFSYEPFAVAGHSRHSNGASWNASGKGESTSDSLKPNAMFSSEPNIPWHADLPTLPGGKLPLSIDLLVYESYLQSSYLHDDLFKLDRLDMLALFLGRDIPDRDRMESWIPLFAARHGLDMKAARERASGISRRLKMSRFVEYAAAFRDIYRLEPRFGVRMRDVYEASVVAATVLATRPNMLRSYAGTIGKRLGRATVAA